ncbi:protein PLASTID REDOX INSENSITIVE 2, chloroplastic [Punica granatum]|uniref:Uncharacterized protein n=2 Tax=Punica granatum TaxID=22663 RepID=A0A2I0JKZ1_PUNGR|nr:protein PLASTID REDOX INSENSITIVE 2, chloroplastic [Punica granatum]PKI56216.1 hypothetical protein CRG98_023411 [Punica granatum]
MAWSLSSRLSFSRLDPLLPFSSSSSSSSSSLFSRNPGTPRLHQRSFLRSLPTASNKQFGSTPSSARSPSGRHVCRAAEYKFPDPIPEFADEETEKFRDHLAKKLSKKDIFGDSIQDVVGICTEVFSTFLHSEYGGPGTLLVMPFIDMADTINERGLPGGPQAARAAIKWAQAHVDKDWNEWTGEN